MDESSVPPSGLHFSPEELELLADTTSLPENSDPVFPNTWGLFAGLGNQSPNGPLYNWGQYPNPTTPSLPLNPDFNLNLDCNSLFAQYPNLLDTNSASLSSDTGHDQANHLLHADPCSPTFAQQQLQSEYHEGPRSGFDIYQDARKPVDYTEASQQGFDIYNTAIGQWSPTPYDPFSPSGGANFQRREDSTEKTDLQSTKPSYSDIAKSSKAKSQVTSHQDKIDHHRKLLDHANTVRPGRSVKTSRNKSTCPTYNPRSRTTHVDTLGQAVPPNSKYGLDHFEPVQLPTDKRKRGVDLDNRSQSSRKGSTSSISSNTSGMDDGHCAVKPSINSFSSDGSGKESFTINLPKSPTIQRPSQYSTNNQSAPSPVTENRPSHAACNNAKVFFDPKRIFQPKVANKKQENKSLATDDSLVLNNGKPVGANKPTSPANRNTDYINNDLSDTRKKKSNHYKDAHSSKRNKDEGTSAVEKPKTRTSPRVETINSDEGIDRRQGMPLQNNFNQAIDEWVSYSHEKAKQLLRSLWSLLIALVVLLASLVLLLASGIVHILITIVTKTWSYVGGVIWKYRYRSSFDFDSSNPTNRKMGVDENIQLPSTGDEAMQRLLSCKGKDPYSILGLRCDSTDEEVKKYYRRQAVLVHPDKNQQLGAEESFKILGHAFELIGEPEKRKAYDMQMREARDAEAAMQEFTDLLTKLQDKIRDAADIMRCENCGGNHRRTFVDRPIYSARYCDKCDIRHSAKEGDVWAETRMYGFLWHYYACMGGKVFDITSWVACQKDSFKHLQANAHQVFYRIATEGNHDNHNNRHGEENLEDFLSHLFHDTMKSENPSTAPQQAPGWNPNAKRRRRKKRH